MKQNKTFKFGQEVYLIVQLGDYFPTGYVLLKGNICGVRKFSTAFSDLLYSVETSRGVYHAFPTDIYESVDDFKADVENHIV